jgi:hypothetical protein
MTRFRFLSAHDSVFLKTTKTLGLTAGITTAILSASGSNAGIGFAIPVDVVNRIVPELIRN